MMMVGKIVLDGPPLLVTLGPNGTYEGTVGKVLQLVTAILFQAHSDCNVSIGPVPSLPAVTDSRWKAVTGSSIGFVYLLTDNSTTASILVRNELQNNQSVQVQISALGLSGMQPIPGGCSLDWNLPNVPAVLVKKSKDSPEIEVRWEPADKPFNRRNSIANDCDDSPVINDVVYEVYGTFLNDFTFGSFTDDIFSAVANFQSLNSVTKYGTKICCKQSSLTTRVSLASWPSDYSLLLSVIVRNTTTGQMSPYIPYIVNGCYSDSCTVGSSWSLYFLLAVTCIFGFLLCFDGHRRFSFAQFLIGLSVTGAAGSIFILYFSGNDTTTNILLRCIGFGLIGGLMFLVIWESVGSPLLSVFLILLSMGYFSACILSYFLFDKWELFYGNNLSHFMVFFCVQLATVAALLYFVKIAHIIACVFVGASGLVCCGSVFAKGSLHFVLIRSAYRFSYTSYTGETCFPVPFSKIDLVLSVIWGLILFSGCAVQIYLNRRHPGFPSAPSPLCRKLKNRLVSMYRNVLAYFSRRSNRQEPLIEPEVDANDGILSPESC